jgi:hypothetical protein
MIQQKIKDDLIDFLKAGKSFEVGVLRLISSVFKNKEIEKKGRQDGNLVQEAILTDEEVVDILMKEVKKRKEAADIYKKGDRENLAEKEMKELEVIKKYLPEELSAEEIEKIVNKAIAVIGAASVKDIGKVMAEAMKELKGRADASAVGAMIKKKLENGK